MTNEPKTGADLIQAIWDEFGYACWEVEPSDRWLMIGIISLQRHSGAPFSEVLELVDPNCNLPFDLSQAIESLDGLSIKQSYEMMRTIVAGLLAQEAVQAVA